MYVTYKGPVCCLDSLRESKQKSNFLVFSLAAQACGPYLALLDILSLSQYLMFAGFYLKRRFLCELVCRWRWFREDVHNIDLQPSLSFHLFSPLHLSGAAVELFHDRNIKWLISLADGRSFVFLSPTSKMELKQWITQWIISCLFSYWAQQQAFAKIVPVTGELVVSHTECCVFVLRNIKIRERVLGCLVLVFLDEVPNRTYCIVRVILFR